MKTRVILVLIALIIGTSIGYLAFHQGKQSHRVNFNEITSTTTIMPGAVNNDPKTQIKMMPMSGHYPHRAYVFVNGNNPTTKINFTVKSGTVEIDTFYSGSQVEYEIFSYTTDRPSYVEFSVMYNNDVNFDALINSPNTQPPSPTPFPCSGIYIKGDKYSYVITGDKDCFF